MRAFRRAQFRFTTTLSIAPLLVSACTDLTARAEHLAQQANLEIQIIQGTQYRHEIFAKDVRGEDNLFVFIDSDGSPWRPDGREPSADPTPRRPLALQLAVQTPHTVLYVGRPCYFATRHDAACRAPVWTSERYSTGVVESMAAVVNRYVATRGIHHIVLIGYSGGGTLAVLMAPRISATPAVITIAANLDVVSWSRWHRYTPLAGSLNPATEPPLNEAIPQWHLIGGQDQNVPESVSRRYLDTLHPEQIWRFDSFDHRCCWVRDWPLILARIGAAMDDARF